MKPTVDQVRNLGMHAAYYNWDVEWVTLPAGITGFTTSDLNTRAFSIQAPTRQLDESEIVVRGNKVYQHGIATYQPIALTLHETVDRKVASFLEAWLDTEWETVNGVQVPKNENQAIIKLSLCDSKDRRTAEYTMVGCWLTSFDHGGDYDGTNSDTVKYTCNIRYDYYKYKKL